MELKRKMFHSATVESRKFENITGSNILLLEKRNNLPQKVVVNSLFKTIHSKLGAAENLGPVLTGELLRFRKIQLSMNRRDSVR